MKKKGEGASNDDTKSISPSRHVPPISRMNGMFRALSLSLSLSLFSHRTFELRLGEKESCKK